MNASRCRIWGATRLFPNAKCSYGAFSAALIRVEAEIPKQAGWVMSYGFVIHTDFEEILDEVAKLTDGDKAFMNEIITFVNSLRDLTFKVEPAMKLETRDERQLWKQYQQLQREKLVLLDRSHEYESMERL